MKVSGGKAIYGASVGILMLEAQFPRIPGDMGHAGTWPFPVLYRVVRDASPDRVVRQGDRDLLPAFIDAAKDLVADGADGITTNCGFLAMFQDELAAELTVPVATSSLMQVAAVNAILPKGKRAGILTISGSTLSAEHLDKARVPKGTPIATTEGGAHFTEAILGNAPELDVALAESDNVAAAQRLVHDNPDIGAIVLECTNMTPYAAAIQAATKTPVFSMVSFMSWFQSGLAPRIF